MAKYYGAWAKASSKALYKPRLAMFLHWDFCGFGKVGGLRDLFFGLFLLLGPRFVVYYFEGSHRIQIYRFRPLDGSVLGPLLARLGPSYRCVSLFCQVGLCS